MKTINFSKIIFAIGFLAGSLSAQAADSGNDSGNGGGGITCIQSSGHKTVTLLDLQEASKNPQFTIKRSNLPWPQQLEAALQKYAVVEKDYVSLMRQELSYIQTDTVLVSGSQRLPPPSDTNMNNLDEPSNCFLEGVANYDDSRSKLYIDEDLFNLLPETDRAALYFHEAWYRVQRTVMSSTGNSKDARAATGAVFAQEALAPVSAETSIQNAISQCASEDRKFGFYIIPQSAGYELLFTRINGISLGERTSIVVQNNIAIPGKLDVDGDILNALSEGLSLIQRDSTKDEKSTVRGGTSVLMQKYMYALVKSKYGPSIKVLLTSSDWASQEGITRVDLVSQYGLDNNQSKLGRMQTYENASSFISIQQNGKNISQQMFYSNGVNSRVSCVRLK